MNSYSYGNEAAPVLAGCIIFVYILFVLGISALTVIAFCKIFSKAGYHWALGLIMLVPLGNLVMLLILAFGECPIHKQMRQMQTPPPMQPGEPPRENFRGI